MFKKSHQYGSDNWANLAASLTLTSMLTTGSAVVLAIVVSGPAGLVASLTGLSLAGTSIIRSRRLARGRRQAMYLLSDQTQDLAKLRAQLAGDDHVLITRYTVGGKVKEAFIGDKNEPFKGVPGDMILSFKELLAKADKDDGDAVAMFFGRPL